MNQSAGTPWPWILAGFLAGLAATWPLARAVFRELDRRRLERARRNPWRRLP